MLTAANRILIVYISIENPSDDLLIMSKYIINVYSRTWFAVEAQPIFTKTPNHIHNMTNNTKALNDQRIIDIVKRIISNNSYSLHSENLLCAMLNDERPSIRFKAAQRIIECRSIDERTVRKFEKPIINFDAEEYFDLIDNEGTWLESVLTKHISTDYINNIVPVISFPPYPSHTQSVERHIRLVSQTSKTIISADKRDVRINITLMERKLIPNFISKRDFIQRC